MEEIKIIDIIIPAYNHKEELERALVSIVNQTKRDKCIVTVVDDCSSENIYDTIMKYSKILKINYIKNEKNLKYPGLVRQVGIDNTLCPFIMFLDSDDILAPNAVEMANSEMLKTNSDMILGYFYAQEKNNLYKLMDESDSTWLHGNVYKRSFLDKFGIRFPSGYNEDGGFNTQCFLLTKKVAVLPMPMYYWLNCTDSLTRNNDSFCTRNCGDIVGTLTEAYLNVIGHIGFEDVVLNNFGNHLGLFWKLSYDIKEFQNTHSQDEDFNQFYENLQIFYRELEKICALFTEKEEEVNWEIIKKGCINAYIKYQNGKIDIDINEFLGICGLSSYFQISKADLVVFTKERDNENNFG